jgi:hypothetical protein
VLRGRITAVSFLGTLARYWVDAGGTGWIVDVPAPGETVLAGEAYLQLPREQIHILEARG